jgi:heme A synthase
MAVACYYAGQRFYPIPYRVAAGLGYIVLTILVVYGVNSIVIQDQTGAFVVHNLIFLVYLCVVYLIERRGLKASRSL